MEFYWTSFFLECINFFVLLWILKHFFYRPIKNALLTREQGIQDKLMSAKNKESSAQKLKVEFEDRLKAWEREKKDKQTIFSKQLEEWKTQEINHFQKNMDNMSLKRKAQDQQYLAHEKEKYIHDAMKLAMQFATRFLLPFADKSLEDKMIASTIEALSHLTEDKRQNLQENAQNFPVITIQSAYEIGSHQKNYLQQAIQDIIPNANIQFKINKTLLAGLVINIGHLVLKANLQEELDFFAHFEIRNDE